MPREHIPSRSRNFCHFVPWSPIPGGHSPGKDGWTLGLKLLGHHPLEFNLHFQIGHLLKLGLPIPPETSKKISRFPGPISKLPVQNLPGNSGFLSFSVPGNHCSRIENWRA